MIPIGLECLFTPELIQPAAVDGSATRSAAAFAFHDECVLGTHLKLLVNARTQDDAFAAARRCRAEIDRLDAILDWRTEASELARLNRSNRLIASPDLFTVVVATERWNRLSKGAYSGRLGRLTDLWRSSVSIPPDPARCEELARDAARAHVGLDATTSTITRPDAVKFDLDGYAKGYIIDRALDAVLISPGVEGALLDIGGDIRAVGRAPDSADWVVGLPDPLVPFDNAALVGEIRLHNKSIATSGCGPRDKPIGGEPFSATIDPRTGWPIPHKRSVTAIAETAADADALATSLLTLPHEDGVRLVDGLPGASARVTQPDAAHWISGAHGASAPPAWTPVHARADQQSRTKDTQWHDGWSAFVTFTAPPRQKKRDRAFRSPYVAIWIADAENRPVRTLVLIGSIKEWQEDNYIWWGQHRASAQDLLDTRSMSTRGSGQYRMLWDGIDEAGNKMAPGKYVLHIETSRERGRHTHRSLELDFTKARTFTAEIPTSEEAGGLVVSFERY